MLETWLLAQGVAKSTYTVFQPASVLGARQRSCLRSWLDELESLLHSCLEGEPGIKLAPVGFADELVDKATLRLDLIFRQEDVSIFMPLEIGELLSAAALKRRPSPILAAEKENKRVGIALLAADVISRGDLTRRHGAFVKEVSIVTPLATDQRQPSAELRAPTRFLAIRADIGELSFPLSIQIGPKLCLALNQRAQLQPFQPSERLLLANGKVNCSARFALPLSSLLEASTLAVGDVLKFPNEEVEGEICLAKSGSRICVSLRSPAIRDYAPKQYFHLNQGDK